MVCTNENCENQNCTCDPCECTTESLCDCCLTQDD